MPDLRSPLPSPGPNESPPVEGLAGGRITGAVERSNSVNQIAAFKASLLERALLMAGGPIAPEIASVTPLSAAPHHPPSSAPNMTRLGHSTTRAQEHAVRPTSIPDPEGSASEAQTVGAVHDPRKALQALNPISESKLPLDKDVARDTDSPIKIQTPSAMEGDGLRSQRPETKEPDKTLSRIISVTGGAEGGNTDYRQQRPVQPLPVEDLSVDRRVSEVVDTFATKLLNEPSRQTAHSIREILMERSEPVGPTKVVDLPPSTAPTKYPPAQSEILASINDRLTEMKSSLEIISSSRTVEAPQPTHYLPKTGSKHVMTTPEPIPPSGTPLFSERTQPLDSVSVRPNPRVDRHRLRQRVERPEPSERIRSLIDAMGLGIKRVRLLRTLQEIDNALELGCLSLAGLAALGALGTYHALLALSETAAKVALAIRSEESQSEAHNADLIANLAEGILCEQAAASHLSEEPGCGMVADITGRIVYTGTQLPLEGIAVRGGPLGSIRTDPNGTFLFKNVPLGSAFRIEVMSANYDYDTPSIEGIVSTTNHFVVQGKRR